MALPAAAANRHSSREQSQWHAGGFHLHYLGDISGKHRALDMNTGSAERCLTYNRGLGRLHSRPSAHLGAANDNTATGRDLVDEPFSNRVAANVG